MFNWIGWPLWSTLSNFVVDIFLTKLGFKIEWFSSDGKLTVIVYSEQGRIQTDLKGGHQLPTESAITYNKTFVKKLFLSFLEGLFGNKSIYKNRNFYLQKGGGASAPPGPSPKSAPGCRQQLFRVINGVTHPYSHRLNASRRITTKNRYQMNMVSVLNIINVHGKATEHISSSFYRFTNLLHSYVSHPHKLLTHFRQGYL